MTKMISKLGNFPDSEPQITKSTGTAENRRSETAWARLKVIRNEPNRTNGPLAAGMQSHDAPVAWKNMQTDLQAANVGLLNSIWKIDSTLLANMEQVLQGFVMAMVSWHAEKETPDQAKRWKTVLSLKLSTLERGAAPLIRIGTAQSQRTVAEQARQHIERLIEITADIAPDDPGAGGGKGDIAEKFREFCKETKSLEVCLATLRQRMDEFVRASLSIGNH